MGSYYDEPEGPEEVRVAKNERLCTRCKGSGSVELHGQETDCIDCEGYGSVLI
jgi:DnaJ-class molecular chaperone